MKKHGFIIYCVVPIVSIIQIVISALVFRSSIIFFGDYPYFMRSLITNPILSNLRGRNPEDLAIAAGKEYKNVLENINQYEFSGVPQGDYNYAIWDVNSDGIDDLILTDFYKVKNDSGYYVTRSATKVFSYDGKKLNVMNGVIHSIQNKFESSTLFFYRNHRGLVLYIPESEQWYEKMKSNTLGKNEVFPWREVSYRFFGTKIKTKTKVVKNPLPKNENDEAEMSDVTAPSYIPVSDLTDVNSLINIKKRDYWTQVNAKQKLKWQEDGYQVFTGVVEKINMYQAYDFPGTSPEDSGISIDNYMSSSSGSSNTIVLTLDSPRSAASHCNGTECGYRPMQNEIRKVAIVLSNSSSDKNDDDFTRYIGKKTIVATKNMYVTAADFPWNQPIISSSEYTIVKLMNPVEDSTVYNK